MASLVYYVSVYSFSMVLPSTWRLFCHAACFPHWAHMTVTWLKMYLDNDCCSDKCVCSHATGQQGTFFRRCIGLLLWFVKLWVCKTFVCSKAGLCLRYMYMSSILRPVLETSQASEFASGPPHIFVCGCLLYVIACHNSRLRGLGGLRHIIQCVPSLQRLPQLCCLQKSFSSPKYVLRGINSHACLDRWRRISLKIPSNQCIYEDSHPTTLMSIWLLMSFCSDIDITRPHLTCWVFKCKSLSTSNVDACTHPASKRDSGFTAKYIEPTMQLVNRELLNNESPIMRCKVDSGNLGQCQSLNSSLATQTLTICRVLDSQDHNQWISC